MKKKNQIIMASILACIILVLAYSIVNASPDKAASEIYIFEIDLPSGTQIKEEMIKKIRITHEEKVQGAVIHQDDILGKYIHHDFNAGQIIMSEELFSNKPSDTYGLIPEGTILYTLPMRTENANGWWISEGGEIDIYIKSKDNDSIEILDSVTVIKIMDQFGNDTSNTENPPQILCLGVNEQQAKRLLIAQDIEIIKVIPKK